MVILGGTDVNCCLDCVEQRAKMADIFQHAQAVVAFNDTMKQKLCGAFPLLVPKVTIIPQSCPSRLTTSTPVESCAAPSALPSPETASSHIHKWRERLGYAAQDFLVLLPASIRAVKAPHFIIKKFQQYQAKENSTARLLIMGPILEQEYIALQPELERVMHTYTTSTTSSSVAVQYHDALPRDDFLELLREVNVVLNTSESEGECGAILEAMSLGVPVVARDIPGNASLVRHGHTGWLFHTAEECVRLLASVHARTGRGGGEGGIEGGSVAAVTNNALAFIRQTHSEEAEVSLYASVLFGCGGPGTGRLR